MSSVTIKYRELIECIWNNITWDVFLRQKFELDEENIPIIIQTLNKSFLPHFNKKMKDVNRDRGKFRKKFCVWMDNEYVFNTRDSDPKRVVSNGCVGRPSKSFDECKERSRRSKNGVFRRLILKA